MKIVYRGRTIDLDKILKLDWKPVTPIPYRMGDCNYMFHITKTIEDDEEL